MKAKRGWLFVVVLAIVAAVVIAHSLIDQTVATDTAPIVRSDDQNSGTRAPNEQVPAAGTTGSGNP
jgi:hypothetical protein